MDEKADKKINRFPNDHWTLSAINGANFLFKFSDFKILFKWLEKFKNLFFKKKSY